MKTDTKKVTDAKTSEEIAFDSYAKAKSSEDKAKAKAKSDKRNDALRSRRPIAKTSRSGGKKAKTIGDYANQGGYRWDLDLINKYAFTNQVSLVFAGYQDWLIVNNKANGNLILKQQVFDHMVADFEVVLEPSKHDESKMVEVTYYSWYDFTKIDDKGEVILDPETGKPFISVFKQDPIQIVKHYSSGSNDQITKCNYKA